ncbi:MAG: hypothetical protein IPJ69_02035 [Deltaproteobacteria bacterium]|nr:MAG: hypothetical protein IPJ69_02035 [Deltaproteobacteria bacterium]
MVGLFEKKEVQKMATFSFYLPKSLVEEAKKLAKVHDLSASEVVQRLMEEGLRIHKEKEGRDKK